MRARSRRSRGPVVAVLAAGALLLSACGDEPADREALIRAMERQGELTTEEATCVAAEIFDNSGLTESQINEGANDIARNQAFQAAFETAIATCAGL